MSSPETTSRRPVDPTGGEAAAWPERSSPAAGAATIDPTLVSRLVAGIVLAAGAALIFLSPDRGAAALLLAPVLVGTILPLTRWPVGTDRINGLDDPIARRLELARAKIGKFSRYFSRPLFAGTLAIWRRTAPVADPHVRAGLRATFGLFFGALMVGALAVVGYVLLVIALAIVAVAFALWAVGKAVSGGFSSSSTGGEADDEPVPAGVGPRGTRIVREGFFNDTPTGTAIDGDGRIVRQGFFGDTPSGSHIDEDGRLVEEGFFGDTPNGIRIRQDGRIVKEGFFGDIPTGKRIDEDGRLVEEGFFGDTPTGTRFVKR